MSVHEPQSYSGELYRRYQRRGFTSKRPPVPLKVFKRTAQGIEARNPGWVKDRADLGFSYGPGFPRALTGPGRSLRDPVQLSEGFRRFRDEHAQTLARVNLRSKWAQIVGPQIASHARIEQMEDEKLVLRTDSTPWMSQLRALIPAIMRKIGAEQLGISQIVVVGPVAPSWKKGPLSVPGRGPRDTYG